MPKEANTTPSTETPSAVGSEPTCYAIDDLIKKPFTGSSINDFEVNGYDLRKSTDRNKYRHFKQHVYRVKGSDNFRKNQSRLDTVKHYSPCFDVWEYFPA